MVKQMPSRVGRPCKGDQKRVRVSFTLHPRHVAWLLAEATARRKSRSELLDDIFEKIQKHWEKPARLPVSSQAVERFCQEHGIRKLSIFGSALTKKFGPQSDIDILVEFEPNHIPGLLKMVSMENELSKLFGGRKIDLKTPQELSRYFREEAMRKSEVLYAA